MEIVPRSLARWRTQPNSYEIQVRSLDRQRVMYATHPERPRCDKGSDAIAGRNGQRIKAQK